jgi:excinuclease ABC subunit C
MIRDAQHLTYIEAESDIEALILESQLIKQKRPKFNIVLRDDKQYFYVAFTNDAFPRLFLTHQTSGRIKQRNHDVKEFIGPFTDGAALKATLKFLRNIFPYCTCTQKHHNFCLNYHIGKCIGYCCLVGDQPQEQKDRYAADIKALRDILNGKKSSLVKDLRKEMEQAGKDHDFEKAIELRNKIDKLERVFYNAQVIQHSDLLRQHTSELQKKLKIKKPIIRIEGYDISNIQGTHATGSMVTFVHGLPDKNFYRKFNIKTVYGANDTAMLREIIERRFHHPEWPFPDLIIIDGGKGQVNSALATLKEMSIKIPLVGLSKDERHTGKQLVVPGRKTPILLHKLPEPDRNLVLAIDAEAHRFAINQYRHLHGKSFR